ncbi:unnamed protein product, partial [Linum tenue]
SHLTQRPHFSPLTLAQPNETLNKTHLVPPQISHSGRHDRRGEEQRACRLQRRKFEIEGERRGQSRREGLVTAVFCRFFRERETKRRRMREVVAAAGDRRSEQRLVGAGERFRRRI